MPSCCSSGDDTGAWGCSSCTAACAAWLPSHRLRMPHSAHSRTQGLWSSTCSSCGASCRSSMLWALQQLSLARQAGEPGTAPRAGGRPPAAGQPAVPGERHAACWPPLRAAQPVMKALTASVTQWPDSMGEAAGKPAWGQGQDLPPHRCGSPPRAGARAAQPPRQQPLHAGPQCAAPSRSSAQQPHPADRPPVQAAGWRWGPKRPAWPAAGWASRRAPAPPALAGAHDRHPALPGCAPPGSGPRIRALASHWTGCTRRGLRTARAAFSAQALSGARATHSAWDCSARASAVRVPSSPLGTGSSAVLPRRRLAESHACFGKQATASRSPMPIVARLWARPSAAPARACSSLACSCHDAGRLLSGAATSSRLARRPRAHARSHTSSASWSAASLLSASPCAHDPPWQCRPRMRRSQLGQPLANPQCRPCLGHAGAQQRAQHVGACTAADLRAAALACQAADAQSATQRALHAACGSGLWSSARYEGVPCCTPGLQASKHCRSTRLTVPDGSKRSKGVRVAGAPNSACVVGSACRQVGEQLGHDREQLPGAACRTTLFRPRERLTCASTAQHLGRHPAAARG